MRTIYMKGLITLGAAAVVAMIAMGVWVSRPATVEHPPLGVTIAHAEISGSTGCDTCHKSPITTVNCQSCHGNPPTNLDQGVSFPHHDPTKNLGVTCQSCHATAANDARYVTTPDAGHTFCTSCHGDPKHNSV